MLSRVRACSNGKQLHVRSKTSNAAVTYENFLSCSIHIRKRKRKRNKTYSRYTSRERARDRVAHLDEAQLAIRHGPEHVGGQTVLRAAFVHLALHLRQTPRVELDVELPVFLEFFPEPLERFLYMYAE